MKLPVPDSCLAQFYWAWPRRNGLFNGRSIGHQFVISKSGEEGKEKLPYSPCCLPRIDSIDLYLKAEFHSIKLHIDVKEENDLLNRSDVKFLFQNIPNFVYSYAKGIYSHFPTWEN